MKKFLGVLVIFCGLMACNSGSSSSENVKDSVLEKVDSTGEARVDSVESATDTKERIKNTFEKTDSANKAIADSAK